MEGYVNYEVYQIFLDVGGGSEVSCGVSLRVLGVFQVGSKELLLW